MDVSIRLAPLALLAAGDQVLGWSAPLQRGFTAAGTNQEA